MEHRLWLFMQAQCIKNLSHVIEAAGITWDHIMKVNIYLKKMEDFDAINEVYEKVGFPQACSIMC